ncbi:flagellar hook protein FlgE [Elstera cyanobacteriorum]|uniref:flagellar hook protein FlgE n=1 Tax=Elstera cyanobacteriorum TaxID=2022747 RepID=UPI002355AE83|nr:flagellar hook-basal body complex protein [Elstera cyanobacteriorum]MCK6442384.1 flagellar hook-basal body complex protein [Elstera cyanobacteriorum]
MSIYGSLKAGVTGLKSQASSMAMISDNIANANTIGYKRSVADFETLVTKSGSTAAYAPGGVRANTVALIDQQGLINASSSTTDIAIAGRGFFAVANSVSANGSVPTGTERLYTRAGSFRTNSEGFLTSASGEYLLGVPADSSGNVPTATLPVDQLKAINVGSITGSAKATGTVSIGANLPATSAPPTNKYTVTMAATSAIPFPPAGGPHNFPLTGLAAGVAGFIDPSVDPAAAAVTPTYTAGNLTFTVSGSSYIVSINDIPTAGQSTQVGTITAAGTLDFNTTVAVTGGQLALKITGPIGAGGPTLTAPTNTLTERYAVRMADSTGAASSSTSAQFDLSTGSGIQSGYTSDVTVYDSLGVGHNIQLAYIKTAANTWDVYVTKMTIVGRTDANGNPIDSITGSSKNSFVFDGTAVATGAYDNPTAAAQAAAGRLRPSSRLGTLSFNTNGSISGFAANATARLNSSVVTAGADLSSPQSTGAAQLNPTFNFGTVGTKNGVTQQSDAFATSFINQDGVRFGYKTGVAVDKDGVVRAVFDNGQRLAVARVAIVAFADPNKLDARSGNLYAQTDASGSPTTNFSGIGGAGTIQSNALEGSTVDLAEEFTDMIVTQRNYSANSKTITTSDEMLQEIINLKR